MRNLISCLAAGLALVPMAANAAEAPDCLTKAEFSSLASYAMPSVISGATKRCSQTLTTTSYLPSNGQMLASSYAARRDANWPAAKSAFLKLGAPGKDKTMAMLADLPDESLREVLDVMLEGLVSQEIPLEKCGTIDEVARLLAPLPPQNTADLIALTASLVGNRENAKPSRLKVCKD